jgi:hypothetical protein
MVSQITTVQQVHYQVQALSVLESVVHVDEERVVKLSEDLPLIHDRLNTSLRKNSRFAHFLHGIVLLGLLTLNSPDFTKATLADAELVNERRLAHSYN